MDDDELVALVVSVPVEDVESLVVELDEEVEVEVGTARNPIF